MLGALIEEAYKPLPAAQLTDDDDEHDRMLGQRLAAHAYALSTGHPDRYKFLLESAKLRTGARYDPANTALQHLQDPYDVPHEAVEADRLESWRQRARFEHIWRPQTEHHQDLRRDACHRCQALAGEVELWSRKPGASNSRQRGAW